LAEGIINQNINEGDTLLMDREAEKDELTIEIKKAKVKNTNKKKEE
jgi:hypothetical protein